MFVTLDGPNGVGKSSCAEALTQFLRSTGRNVVLLHQPSDSALGELARRSEEDLSGIALAALVVADRYLQIHETIKPALAQGKIVVCDRYVASTLALQRLDGIELDLLWEMNRFALVPELSVLLTADAATIEQRLSTRKSKTRFERRPGLSTLELALFREAFNVLRNAGYLTYEVSTTASSSEAVAQRIAEQLIST
jgi:dTMP kinase